jgi:hypothetical protein
MINIKGFIKISSNLSSNVFNITNEQGYTVATLSVNDISLADTIETEIKKYYVESEHRPMPDTQPVYSVPVSLGIAVRK